MQQILKVEGFVGHPLKKTYNDADTKELHK